MLRKMLGDLFPGDYRYRSSEWYRSLEKKYTQYRYGLNLLLMASASLIPLTFAVTDLVSDEFSRIIHYAIPLVLLGIASILLIVTKKTGLFSVLTMLFCIAGFILAAYLPHSRNVGIVIFFCFPPVAFQLFGKRKGSWWVVTFFATVITMYALNAWGWGPFWKVYLPDTNNMILGFVSLLLITIIAFFGERQHEKSIALVVRNALFDETTELPTRKVLLEYLHEKSYYLFAIVHIKNFSDLGLLFGYELSDDILRFFSRQLVKYKSEYDYCVFRMKGNEFGILLRLVDETRGKVLQRMEAVREILQSESMPWEGSELRLNIHIGGVIFHSEEADESGAILSKADIALKASLERRRGVMIFEGHESLKKSALRSTRLFSVLCMNNEKKAYKAFFQPIVRSDTGETVWYESLLRIRNFAGAYESPVPYLSIAESTGLDRDLTRFMIREALAALRRTGKDISVNISFKDMMGPDLAELLDEHHRESTAPGGRLILEILERSDMGEEGTCVDFLHAARDSGCLIAIDDFGSGYSNFGNLMTLPVDIIKINGALVQQMEGNEKAKRMIENIIHFCKQTGLIIAAEWVDSPMLAHELTALGVDFLQGFHFGYPKEMAEPERRGAMTPTPLDG